MNIIGSFDTLSMNGENTIVAGSWNALYSGLVETDAHFQMFKPDGTATKNKTRISFDASKSWTGVKKLIIKDGEI